MSEAQLDVLDVISDADTSGVNLDFADNIKKARHQLADAKKLIKQKKKELRNEQRRKSRLVKKASKLDENDLLQALVMKKKNKLEKAEREKANDSSSASSTNTAPVEPGEAESAVPPAEEAGA